MRNRAVMLNDNSLSDVRKCSFETLRTNKYCIKSVLMTVPVALRLRSEIGLLLFIEKIQFSLLPNRIPDNMPFFL